MKKGLIFIGVGFELLALILAALYLGGYIDKQLGWPGYGVAGLVVIMMISWFFHLFFLLKRFMAESPDDPET